MRNLGLRNALKRFPGACLSFRIKDLYWEIRYAWQRAWKGYDDTDIFELGYNFMHRMPTLLKEYKDHYNGLFYDTDKGRVLTEEEMNQLLDEMIFYFENCDEEHVYERLYGQEFHYPYGNDWKQVNEEVDRCQKEALRLFSKWCAHLWY